MTFYNNVVLITSVIDPPNLPLSYYPIRNVFTKQERFTDTKKTINSIKKYIPNPFIFIVECSDLSETENAYFESECDYVFNLWDKKEHHSKIFGISKSMGEGTMTVLALERLFEKNITFNNFIKICGRYWFDKPFSYSIFDNNKIVFKPLELNNNINICTIVYKLPTTYLRKFYDYLTNFDTQKKMIHCIGYEILFGKFIQLQPSDIKSSCGMLFVYGRVTIDNTKEVRDW